MRIVDRKTFLSLPENTLYSKYTPCVFGDLEIKGESVSDIDFYSQNISDAIVFNDTSEFVDALTRAENGESIDMDFHCICRDGLFDKDQLFAIWENKDVLALIDRLKECVKNENTNPQGA